ncbi:LysM peptidoglycan-binding domain-containing protein [Mesobacillus zeae]|uniref:LysM domain-containing protein n=1 Tax=Mesobacillus zeae TaxID=1917180 RepID=A0A398B864_9BACI|nr:LysM peptidoglycan-binding domain-containing protein [Mesobacillus zeae]RID85018.1 LysM domain-containing protein [Mesobacillus zeae]
MAKLGRVKLFIEKESDSSAVDATSYPVEKGIPFTDHVQEKPDEVSISGSIIGSNYKEDKEYLKREMKKGTMFTYVGRNIAKNVIILSIDGDVDYSISNGSNISIKLQTIRIATTPWVKVKNSGKKKPVSKKPTKKSKAVYHRVKAGDTYWGLSRKYETSIPQLRKWNKYPDRRIPIGVKLRVK